MYLLFFANLLNICIWFILYSSVFLALHHPLIWLSSLIFLLSACLLLLSFVLLLPFVHDVIGSYIVLLHTEVLIDSTNVLVEVVEINQYLFQIQPLFKDSRIGFYLVHFSPLHSRFLADFPKACLADFP